MGAVLWLPAQYWPEAEGEKEDRRKAKRKRTLNTALHRPWYSTPGRVPRRVGASDWLHVGR
jgi:hypothetical protein